MKSKFNNLKILLFALIFNYLGGYISSLLSGDMKSVYSSLEKPWFAPPGFIFPLVWAILYFLLAYALFLDYRNGGRNILTYVIAMIVNFLWSYIFFAQKLYGIAFLIVVILILFCIYLGVRYFKNSKFASIIMLIYLTWLIYAGLLTYFVWMYNEM